MRRTPLHPGRQRLQVKGESRFPHRRDPAYQAYIRGLPCALTTHLRNLTLEEIAARGWWPCGSRPERDRVEAAHLQTRGAGGDDRGNLVPLCAAHHDEQEGHTKRFCLKYGGDLYQLAGELLIAYEEGEAACG